MNNIKIKIKGNIKEQNTLDQIKTIANSDCYVNSNVVIMPDAHSGKGSCVGFTSTFDDKIAPATIGMDVGCGMTMATFSKRTINFKDLDDFIRKNIPHGVGKINSTKDDDALFAIKHLKMKLDEKDKENIAKSMGTLGGGNHFIEISECDENYYLVVHSGSRSLGAKLCQYYVERTFEAFKAKAPLKPNLEGLEGLEKGKLMQEWKKAHQAHNKGLKDKDLLFLESNDQEYFNYLKDMDIAIAFASQNRKVIIEKILNFLKIDNFKINDCIHNYIDIEKRIIRKGATSANKGELIIVPINMKEGTLLLEGKGNKEWNFSAPHGAGRLFSRNEAKKLITLEEFKKEMSDIATWSVSENTLDEAPRAYKPMKDIIDFIEETATILKTIKPIYNFKAN